MYFKDFSPVCRMAKRQHAQPNFAHRSGNKARDVALELFNFFFLKIGNTLGQFQ